MQAGSPDDETQSGYRAAEQVFRRRTALRPEDPDAAMLPDPDDPDQLLAFASFVSRYRRVPDWVLHDDALDAIRIMAYLQRADLPRRLLSAIRLARRKGATWAVVASALGVSSAQGAEQQYLRLVNAIDGRGGRDEKAGRRHRRERGSKGAPPASQTDESDRTLRAFVTFLLRHEDDLPEDVIDELRYAEREYPLRPGQPTPAGLVAQIKLTLKELRLVDVPAPITQAMHRAERALAALAGPSSG